MDKILGGSSPPIRTKNRLNIYLKVLARVFKNLLTLCIYKRMKGLKLLFTSCLILSAACAFPAFADDSSDVARAATRRSSSTTVTRQQTENTDHTQTTNSSGISRSITPSSTNSLNVKERSTTTRSNNTIVRSNETRTQSDATQQSVSARAMSNVTQRTPTNNSPTSVSTASRTAISRTATNTIPRTETASSRNTGIQTNSSRSAVTTISRNNILNKSTGSVPNTSRAASINASSSRISRAGTLSAEEIISRDSTQCREVYYSCMDEFCANKDSQLKRCACSSRVNEFDSIKEQLSLVEDKLLDFNQRLLTVNMDKEDAEAIFQATEGELAFQQEDSSTSKKLLDEISQKLNDTFDTSSFDANLAPISLSLNVDAAFDSVDSLAGSSTTAKTGTALYSAALPICREMALEVCSQEELDIIESGYQMAIEQDCNTVAKAYQTQQDLAREKIREGSALLDISRLDIYQQRNSDDILTCKKKMLDLLTNTSVCGTDLQKCLDISGQYIDPSTGEAILTANLVNLSSLITRPSENQTWTNAPGNDKFVKYLNSKKMFLESATENCQDIADYVWDQFIEDALAQIKLAQESKLEEVRQGCTTLTTQCLSDAAESIEDFDARALSIFGVEADKTVKQMCSEVQTACTALLDTIEGGQDWNTGMTQIAADKTYDAIIKTCREVGKSCIIQSCKSISGNFGLCENIQTSVNRKAIVNRTACWEEVLECVESAGIDSINAITDQQKLFIDEQNGAFYTKLYGTYDIADITNDELETDFDETKSCIIGENGNCIYDICASECGFDGKNQNYTSATSDKCQICRLAEKVWGNCEAHPAISLQNENSHNKIKIPESSEEETLLSWFAKNTNTEKLEDSCRDTSCGPGMISHWDPTTQSSVCVSRTDFTDDNEMCPLDTFWRIQIGNFNNCCKSTTSGEVGYRDSFGNCCLGNLTGRTINGVNWNTTTGYSNPNATPTMLPINTNEVTGTVPENKNGGLCLPESSKFVMAFPLTGTYYGNNDIGFLFCTGTTEGTDPTSTFPSGKTVTCNGNYIIVTKNTGRYILPNYTETLGNITQPTTNFYREAGGQNVCELEYKETAWQWLKGTTNDKESCENQTPVNWLVE